MQVVNEHFHFNEFQMARRFRVNIWVLANIPDLWHSHDGRIALSGFAEYLLKTASLGHVNSFIFNN